MALERGAGATPCSLAGTSCTPHAAPQPRATGGARQEVSSYFLPRRVTALNSRICLVMATSTGSLSIELAFRSGYRVRVRVRVRVGVRVGVRVRVRVRVGVGVGVGVRVWVSG